MTEADEIKLAREVIQEFEKCHLTSYVVPRESWATIGWGTAIPMKDHPKKITQDEADHLLENGIASRQKMILTRVPAVVLGKMTPFDKAHLLSWAYNTKGWETMGAFLKLCAGDLNEFRRRSLLYVHGEGNVIMAGLVRRRACEYHMARRSSLAEVKKLDWYNEIISPVNKYPVGRLGWDTPHQKLIWLH